MRQSLWILAIFVITLGGPAKAVPWKDGERLRYEVYWGVFMAAEAELSVGRQNEQWRASLELGTRGVVDTFYPVRASFSGWFYAQNLRARRFEAERMENGRRRSHLILMNAERKSAAFTDRVRGVTTRFALPDEETQTVLTLLYVARSVEWRRGLEHTWDVCDRDQLKRVRVRCTGEEPWPRGKRGAARVLVLQAEEIANATGHPPRRPLRARIWVQPQGMVPEAVDLQFIYGTFNLRRKI